MEIRHKEYFKRLIGEENVYDDKAHLLAYCYDATRTRYEPDAVLFPRHEEDVSAILNTVTNTVLSSPHEGQEADLPVGHCLPTAVLS